MRSAVVLLLLGAVACSSPVESLPQIDAFLNGEAVDGLRLSVADDEYRHGETATVHLINESAASVGYNTCVAAREVWTGSEWRRIESLRVCTAELRRLEPGENINFEEAVSAEWQPGRYRIVLWVYRETRNDNLTLATHAFDVTP